MVKSSPSSVSFSASSMHASISSESPIMTALMQLSSTRAAAISASFFFQNSSSVFADAAAATDLVSSGVSSSRRHASSRSSSPSAMASMHCSRTRSAVSSFVLASQSTSFLPFAAARTSEERRTRGAPRAAAPTAPMGAATANMDNASVLCKVTLRGAPSANRLRRSGSASDEAVQVSH